jgi:hypothetical protein
MDNRINLNQLYYVGITRMECLKNELQEQIKEMPKAVAEDHLHVSFNCAIHYPFKSEHGDWLVKTWLYREEKFIFVPRNAIVGLSPAGYPKAGILAERYLDFPWRLLKPIRDFLDQPTSIELFMKALQTEQVFDGLEVTSYYDEHIRPWFDDVFEKKDFHTKGIPDEKLKELEEHYQRAVHVHKEKMLRAFSVKKGGYLYTGVIVNPNIERFKGDNPFYDYLEFCQDHQNQLLGKSKTQKQPTDKKE